MTNITQVQARESSFDIQALIAQWIEDEKNGNQFPVDFDIAWQIAGCSRRDNAKRQIPKSSLYRFYVTFEEKSEGKGRPKQIIKLSIDGLKHLCLMADTQQGEQIRQYFIECEKILKNTDKSDCNEDVLALKAEIAYFEAIKVKTEERIILLKSKVIDQFPDVQTQRLILGLPDSSQPLQIKKGKGGLAIRDINFAIDKAIELLKKNGIVTTRSLHSRLGSYIINGQRFNSKMAFSILKKLERIGVGKVKGKTLIPKTTN